MPPEKKRILHQADVEDVIQHLIDDDDLADRLEFAKRGTAVISSPTAPSATYVQAEITSLKTAIDEIRAALTAAGVTA